MRHVQYGVARTAGGKCMRREPSHAMHVPHRHHVFDEYTVSLADGSLMQVLRLEGFRFETTDTEALARKAAAFNNLLRSQHEHVYLYTNLIRRHEDALPEGAFPPGFSHDLNEAWLQEFRGGKVFTNDYYLTIVMRDPFAMANWWEEWKMRLTRRSQTVGLRVRQQRMAKELSSIVTSFQGWLHDFGTKRLGVSILHPAGSMVPVLTSEVLQLLSYIINGETAPARLPCSTLAEATCQREWWFPNGTFVSKGVSESDTFYGAMLSLREYPSEGTMNGIFDDLLSLQFEVVVSQSFVREQNTFARKRLELQKQRYISAKEHERVINSVEDAIGELAASEVCYGHHHLTIMVRAASPEELEYRVALIKPIFSHVGVELVREGLNMEAAFWAQLPGNREYAMPRGWSLVSTKNIADFASFHAYARGEAGGSYLGSALSICKSKGNTPYFINLHQGKNGSTCIFGKTGSGKTTAAAFLVSQSQKYGGHTIIFDKDGSWENYVRAEDGNYATVRPGEQTGWNPLQLPDTPENRHFVSGFVSLQLSKTLKQSLTREQERRVTEAVSQLYDEFELTQRRYALLRELLINKSLQEALEPWMEKGQYGWLFDSPEHTLSFDQPITGIELGWILDQGEVVRTPAVSFLLYCTKQVVERAQLLRIILEEAWFLLRDEALAAQCEDWVRTMRKKDAFLFFLSQNLDLGSRAGMAIYEQSATKIFFPPFAAERKVYTETLGITEAQYELMFGESVESRTMLIKHGEETVVGVLDLSVVPEYLPILAGDKESLQLMRKLRAKHGPQAADWLPHFKVEVLRNEKASLDTTAHRSDHGNVWVERDTR
ncbi:DUF87 domain-containing protein [Candidatus Kaiserbacteria bacterium]|nr:DUF87 domain-containing protein [Candidatus Kaiserbacteria bacterium]MCB9812451.1 DUF87 domain-containing protein [Candidatus Nomurabacteria bacterium]